MRVAGVGHIRRVDDDVGGGCFDQDAGEVEGRVFRRQQDILLVEGLPDRPGARAVPGSPGEAISRFRGDVN